MNKIIRLLSLTIIFIGCSDFLDTKIDTHLVYDDLETQRGALWQFGSAIYTGLDYGFWAIDNNLFAAASDEAQQTSVTGSVNYFNKGIISPDVNPLSSRYNNYYEGIRAANYFLDYATKKGHDVLTYNRDTVKDIVSYERDKKVLGYYKAEAEIAKAFYYSELIKMYGDVPIVESTLDNDTDPEKIPQSTYDEIVNYIIKLIDSNVEDLTEDWSKEDGLADQTGRFDKKSALAIKSRALLYAASPLNNPTNDVAKWKAAANATHDLLQKINYTLPENRNYRDLFVGNNPVQSKEVIMVVRQANNNDMEINNYPIATPGGRSGVTPSHNLVSSYEYINSENPNKPYDNRDPRLKSSIVVNGSLWNGREIDQSKGGSDDMNNSNSSKTGYYLKKFLTDELNLIQGGTAQHQWIVFRLSEILLNYAEAMNEAFGPDDPSGYTMSAREALMQVRRAASTDLPEVTVTSKDEFREAIKHERRIELAFEDHRYWDLLRWKDAKAVLNQPILGVKVMKNAEGDYEYEQVNVAERVFHDRNYHLPFTRNEVENSGGTLIQNQGY